jgi:hypothetical protein
MAMKYQKGTVYLTGKKVKMWYGKYLIYGQDKDRKEVRKHRNVAICPKAGNPKWKAEQLLREMILKECGVLAEMSGVPSDESLTLWWFVKERYVPMRQGTWSPAYKQTNTDSGPSRHLLGDAADSGDGHAAAWDAEGHAGHVAARAHKDDSGCLCSDDRTERSCRRETRARQRCSATGRCRTKAWALRGGI